MTKISCAAIVAVPGLLLMVQGCVIVRPAAETILTVKRPVYCSSEAERQRVGFRDVGWSETEDKVVIIGSGYHPREHETYAFFINEPSYAFLRRYIRIIFEKGSSEAKIDLMLNSNHICPDSEIRSFGPPDLSFRAVTTCHHRTFLGKCYIDFRDLRLERIGNSGETIAVSGKLRAKQMSPREIISMWERFGIE